MIISQTPFRISFFGGGTDFPEYYREHGGAVIATSIDKYCYLSIHKLGPFFKYRIKANYSRTEAVTRAEEIAHPLIRETLLLLDCNDSLEIGHIADLPGRTGIGSSSSFTVGLLHALHCLRDETVTAGQLAQEAIIVERERVGDSGGHQDQYAAAFGGLNRFDFNANGISVTPVPENRVAELQDRLMIFYTGTEQSAESILTEQSKRTGQNISALKEMKAMVNEAENILRGNRDMSEFGKLLHASWMRKKTLAGGISNSVIDTAYEAAQKAGAEGGKLLGAGGRGFLLLDAEPDRHGSIREALNGLAEVDFAFSREGSKIIFHNKDIL
ncbi:MAG TPA: kinase [Kiritimatiellia bacterium]|nr:kinase [Kiritimatiellia bacterium]